MDSWVCEEKGSWTRMARVGYCVIVILSMLDFAAPGRPTFLYDAGVLEKSTVVQVTASHLEELKVQPSDLKVESEATTPSFSSSSRPDVIFKRMQRRQMSGGELGSTPPQCNYKCSSCNPCTAVRVPIKPGFVKLTEYYPVAWRCKCGDKLYGP